MFACHAATARRLLTAAALAGHEADRCPPRCRACGQPLTVGDYVDPLHPYGHAGNLHQRCDLKAPQPRR